jgi:hypothetical protein
LSSKHLASVEHTSTDTTATTINCPRIVESRLSLDTCSSEPYGQL